MKYNHIVYSFLILLQLSCSKKTDNNGPQIPDTPDTTQIATFTNPLLNGADPWITESKGTYYYDIPVKIGRNIRVPSGE